ncbi:MAG: LLM class flavin-dependent oxidoreductase, partial [Gammaproteobacteria bacterium TMED182]
MTHPFRFAVQSFNADSGKQWAECAQRAEDLGYSALHLADHIIGPGPALTRTNHPIQNLAAVPAMAYAAAKTSTIKIGCRVFCIDYHLPVVLIKEAMTIDLLSEGRLELGLGAGWLAEEYAAIGLTMDSPGERIDRLEHVVGRKLWAMVTRRTEQPTSRVGGTLTTSASAAQPPPSKRACVCVRAFHDAV